MKSTLRAFALIAAVGSVPAAAQQQPEIVVRLTSAQVAEVFRLIDLQPFDKAENAPPEAYWDVQQLFREAIAATPGAQSAVVQARRAAK